MTFFGTLVMDKVGNKLLIYILIGFCPVRVLGDQKLRTFFNRLYRLLGQTDVAGAIIKKARGIRVMDKSTELGLEQMS
jgi:hypothetical protein